MRRVLSARLHAWAETPGRKPLLVRGARQVGKTTLVRQLGKSFPSFIEINLEKQISIRRVFDEAEELDPHLLMQRVGLILGRRIQTEGTLLFIDEIQESPQAIRCLRYFAEEWPELAVIAAGSLLDFVLEEVGLPVGRVSTLWLFPLSLAEFVEATSGPETAAALACPGEASQIAPVHERLMAIVWRYLAIGGMPAVVQQWCDTQDPHLCGALQMDILTSYQQDFLKYAKRNQQKYLQLLWDQVPRKLGEAWRFSHVPGEFRARELAPQLEALNKAGVIYQIKHSNMHRPPLASGANPARFKVLFLDVGLAQASLGLAPSLWLVDAGRAWANRGSLIESFVGQELIANADPKRPHALHYWSREKTNAQSEVDYIIERHDQIIPIEVKAGASRNLRSMLRYLDDHPASTQGIRLWRRPQETVDRILSLPLYAAGAL